MGECEDAFGGGPGDRLPLVVDEELDRNLPLAAVDGGGGGNAGQIRRPRLLAYGRGPPGGGTVFNVIRIREAIELVQRIGAISVDARLDGDWKPIASATSIGACRIIKLDGSVRSHRIRLRITDASAAPALSEFGLYLEDA